MTLEKILLIAAGILVIFIAFKIVKFVGKIVFVIILLLGIFLIMLTKYPELTRQIISFFRS